MITDKKQLIKDHISWADNLVDRRRKHLPRWIEADELRSVAYQALCEAASTYVDDKRTAFATHAFQRIRWSMVDYLREVSEFKFESLDENGTYKDRHNVEVCDFITKVLLPLQPKQRRVMLMFYNDNLTVSEIAKRMNTTNEVVSVWLAVSRKRLREYWSERCCELFADAKAL